MSTATISSSAPCLLHGYIHNLRTTRRNQDFFFTDTDRAKIGATAIAAGLAGLGGIATGLSGMAMDTTEEADLLEFDLNGKLVKAWVWQSVFVDGDEVEVVAEQIDDIWHGYGIRRPRDKIVALHPHCSRGRYAHYRASFRWWIKVLALLLVATYFFIAIVGIFESNVPIIPIIAICAIGGVGAAAITGCIALRIAKKFMGFVRLAEGIFEAFGWANVKNIDLPAITKRNKKPDDPAPLGVLYFRYSDIASDASKWRASGRNSG